MSYAARFANGVLLVLVQMTGAPAAPLPNGRGSVRDSRSIESSCARCHEREYRSQITTSMAHAMEPVASCEILEKHKILSFRDGVYSYKIERQGESSLYTVTDGKDTIRAPLEYAFGLGKAGQTYVFKRDGKMYESRVSFFTALDGLDLTIGAANRKPGNLEEAAGRLMDRRNIEQCFECHSSSSTREHGQPEATTPGVTCEHCHGSGTAHVRGFETGKPAPMKKLSAFSTEELSDFCGQCHRTWAQIAAEGPHDINNVRFQPYRLANSKCYDPSDKRIACTSCHNVHEEVIDSVSFYDRKCMACHAKTHVAVKRAAKNCPVATDKCVSCHMPKLELPGSHYLFTDHRIRIVRVGAEYPQ